MSSILRLKKINYQSLNGRQKENYNFQKISGILADYGYVTIRLSDDWNGADFIAQHIDRQSVLRVQLKGRLAVRQKYRGIDLHICFRIGEIWYLCPHDVVLRYLLKTTGIGRTRTWRERGRYSFRIPSKQIARYIKRFIIA